MTSTRAEVHAVDGPVAWPQLGALGLQHVLVMYSSAIALPVIFGGALRLPAQELAWLVSASLCASGIATLIQCLGVARIGIGLPVAMGATSVAVGPVVAMAAAGVPTSAISGTVIIAGVFTLVLAPFAARLARYCPPLVSGSIITVIGITALRTGVNWAGGGAKNFADPIDLALVALVLATILLANRLFTGLVARVAVLLGLMVGCVVALAVGRVDLTGVRDAAGFALAYPLRFGAPIFDFAGVVPLCLVMLVVMVESSGMFLALGEMCERRLHASDIARGLAANGLGTIVAGVFNTLPQTAYAQNVGLVGLSGVRSRWVVATAGGMLIALGLSPKAGALVAAMPPPVLGGAALAIFGMVAATGIRILARVDYEPRHNLLIIALSIALGMIPLLAPTFFARAPASVAPLLNSGITLAAVGAVLLNAWFNGRASAANR